MKKSKSNVETSKPVTPAQSTPAVEDATRTILYVDKATANVYHLCAMTVEGDKILEDKVIHKDIPGIVYGKLAEALRNQKVRHVK